LAFFVAWPLLAVMLTSQLAVITTLGWGRSAALVFPASALLVVLCHSCWYVAKSTPLRGTAITRLILTHWSSAVVVAAIWSVAVAGLAGLLERGIGWSGLAAVIEPQQALIVSVGLLFYFFSAAYHYLVLALASARDAERRASEARLLAQGSELKALKAQINPHFLFNSLHSISALTGSDPKRARDMCILLSDFLRSTLGLGERPGIPLRDELDQIRKYLTIEKVRFGDRLRFEEEVEEAALDCEVPPLILQPLVENAIKHGVASMIDETLITLRAAPNGASLLLELENQFDPDASARSSTGVGLRNVYERLHAGYGKEAAMRARSDGHRYRVRLTIPCKRVAHHE
jgi:hypothetical protein